MIKRISSLLTLMVMVLTECFTPISFAIAENIVEHDFQVEENTVQEEVSKEDIKYDENLNDSLSDNQEETQKNDNLEEENIQESTENIIEGHENIKDEEDKQNSIENIQEDNNEEVENKDIQQEIENKDIQQEIENREGNKDDGKGEGKGENNVQDFSDETSEILAGSEVYTGVNTSSGQQNNQESEEQDNQYVEENNTQKSSEEIPEIQTGSEVCTGINIPQGQEEKEEGAIETLTEEIVTKIRYFFKKEGDSRYIKYGRDSNNIGTITLKDPKNGENITIMDKNLGANSIGDNGNYYQWGNNSGVKTVNSSNKTTEKAVYKDSYYSRGYNGEGKFIVGGTDYWENEAHYNNLWGNESKESSRYGACPVGYHIPTMKEWNQLLDIWGKIHTQDTSKSEMVLRYSANYATKNIHTFKGAATQCEEGESECVDEDKLSIIIDTLSDELKLPLAGSYDENGNFHDGLGVYWTSISKDGNKAGVFDMNAYIGNGTDSALMYKAQGHNIRCFQNIQPYEAPIAIEIQEEENLEAQNGTEIGTGSKENPLEEASQENKEGLENQKQDSYSGQTIPSEFISYSLVLDTAKDLMDVEMNANGGRFSDNEETKVVKYGYYNQETTIDIKALKQDEYRSGYDIESEIEKISPSPVGYKLMDKVEAPEKEGYIFDGWYTELEGGEKVDLENLLVSEGMKVYAHWTAKEYTITRKNEDGTIKDTTKVPYGQIPTHEDIIQPADEKYTYTFKGWEPEIKEVTGDAEYRATYTYTLRKYTVTWENEDGKVLKTEQLEYGKVPVYSGDTPTKESTEEYEYIFTGWDKEISEVKGNAKYIAKYDAKEIIKEDISTLSHDDENILSGTIEKGSEGSNDLGRGGNIQNSLSDSLKLETGDVESGSALDLLEEIIEVQAETGEILEYTQEDREMELAQIWETLNKQAIEGKKASHHVIVKVSAPVGTFPEGTELRITPIESLKMMQEIKDQLVENTDVTQESELVSFDISFIYTLSNGEEIELQPLEGQTVKVSFNFTYNDTLSQADSDKELKVYHLEEVKDEKGKKTEEVEVKEIEVNKSESSDGELVVDAEKFSVYTIVTQLYEETNNTRTWKLGVDYNEIETQNGSNCITIMDRNLGATTTGAGASAPTTSYGYYYQWGNNYGFTTDTAQAYITSVKPNVSNYGNSNYYSKSFVAGSNGQWMNTWNGNLWGGGDDAKSNTWGNGIENFEGRQGPCPNGWHVPSTYEISLLIEYYGQSVGTNNATYKGLNYTNNAQGFISKYYIPYHGFLLSSGKPSGQGSNFYIISSSPYNAWKVLPYRLNSSKVDMNSLNAHLGFPVRCFKNTYECKSSSDCELDDGTIVSNGDSITAYQNPIVVQGSTCQSETVTCNNGTLNGTYRYSSCSVSGQTGSVAEECNLPWGGTAADGTTVTGYQSASVTYGQSCVGVSATCNDGNWSVENFIGTYLYSGCSIAEPATCSFQGQTIAHNGSLTVYSNASPTCPTTCTEGIVTCNNGTLGGDTSYTNLLCATVSKMCDSSYTLSSEGSHGTYSSCTLSTANGTTCTAGTTVYKLDSCDSGYHTEDGKTCIENTRIQNCSTFNIDHATATVSTFTQTWNNGTWTPATKAWTEGGSECGFSCDTNYTWDSTNSTCKADTKEVLCDASGTPANATADSYNVTVTWNGSDWSSPAACTWTCNLHYHTGANNNSCEIDTFQITWLDGDGQTLKTNTVDYNVVPSYSGPTPTKAATDQYTYTFNNSWSPALVPATVDVIYTAQFDKSINQYTSTITVNPYGYGTVSTDSVTADYGTSISENGNILIVGTTTVIATPTEADVQYTYTFSGWNNTCGNELIGNCTITANFNREVNRYDVIFDSDGGDYTPPTQSIEYGSKATKPTPDPTKIGYEFDGWTLSGNDFNFSTPITGITNLVAKWNLVEYTITYNLDGGTNNDNNPEIYSVESGTITLQQPTKTGYTFLGWTGSNGDNPQTNVEIPTGSYGDKEYNAVWKANTTQYTVYHYVKKVGENIYALSETDILTGTTDEVLVFSSLAKESEFICAHYSSGSLVGTENGPGEIITETTIKGDGSTEVYLYYTRNSHKVTLSGDVGVQMLKINGSQREEAVLECGSDVPVEAVPKPGYHFVRWEEREEKEERENDDPSGS